MGFILSVVWNGMSSPEEPGAPIRNEWTRSRALWRVWSSARTELEQRLLRIEAAMGLVVAGHAGPGAEPVREASLRH